MTPKQTKTPSERLDDWDCPRPILFAPQDRKIKGLTVQNLGNNTLTRQLAWLDAEVDRVKRRLKRTVRIVELGSWVGESAIALAYKNDARLLCVDTWQGSPTPGSPDTGYLAKLQNGPSKIFQLFLQNTKPLGRHMRFFKMTTTEAAEHYPNIFTKPIDLLFIDADHSYEATKADILNWLPHMSQGFCTICGHDYGGIQFPGVEQAVHEIFPAGSIRGFAFYKDTGGIWRVRLNKGKPIIPTGKAGDPDHHWTKQPHRRHHKDD